MVNAKDGRVLKSKPSLHPKSARAIRPLARYTGFGLFALALLIRFLALAADPLDPSPYALSYKGDAVVWTQYARALLTGSEYQLGLPLRPPANAYLLASVWDGEAGSLASIRKLWCLLGALVVWAYFRVIRRQFSYAVAVVAGLWMALSHGMVLLCLSINNETPYLLLLALIFAIWQLAMKQLQSPKPQWLLAAAWGATNALACLLRVEHVLLFAGLSCLLLWHLVRQAPTSRQPLSNTAIGLATFLLCLAPWHLAAWNAISRFNSTEPQPAPAHAQLEQALGRMNWSEPALARRSQLPPDLRLVMSNFVAATVAVRGRQDIQESDFEILEQAFGSTPEPLARFPFVTSYGGLNFALGNHPRATGGFTRALLDELPPLEGGIERYPRFLLDGLPPPSLELTYPPHLEALNRGYGIGWGYIKASPRAFASLALSKVGRFLRGATLGWGASNLPFGRSGTRWAVDLTVPPVSPLLRLWQSLWLGLACWGLVSGGKGFTGSGQMSPWWIWLGCQLLMTLAFFGYARFGAMTVPVVALGLGLAATSAPMLEQKVSHSQAWRTRLWALAALFVVAVVAFDSVAATSESPVRLDKQLVGSSDPFPADQHTDRTLSYP